MPAPGAQPSQRGTFLTRKVLLAAALVLLIGLFWGMRENYDAREQRYRHQIEGELQAISRLQVKSVAEWRERRLSDALALSDDILFAQAVAQWRRAPSAAHEARVRERLRIMEERARYAMASLVDAHGTLLLAPAGTPLVRLPAPEQQALQSALLQAEPAMVEPRRDDFFAFPFFGMLVPIFDGMHPLGAVWLVSDVRTTLYPMLQAWPTPSKTAESFLVQRSSDDILYLSPLKFRSEPPATLRRPLEQNTSLASLAMAGARGILYGRDYRGEDVLAMVSAIPESPWFMVSKVDVEEAFNDVRMREWLALSLPISLLLLFCGFLGAHWQWRAWRREKALKSELERNMRWLDSAQQAASVGYFAYDVGRQQFFMSRMASKIYGLPADGCMTLRQWVRLLHPEERRKILDVHGRAMKQRTPLRTQYRLVRPSDGQARWVEVWAEHELAGEQDRVARMTGTVQDITERKQSEQQLASYRAALEAQVRQDPLTHVANRLALDETVTREWNRAMRSAMPLSLLMIDVDHFKAYNDHYGHVAGDHCLQRVANALTHAVGREGELVARYGGEEFAVLLPETDASQAVAMAHRICAAVRALAMPHQGAQERDHVTVSIGVACIHPSTVVGPLTASAEPPAAFPCATEVAQALFEQADTALYNAKRAGRDRVMACPSPGPLIAPAPSAAPG